MIPQSQIDRQELSVTRWGIDGKGRAVIVGYTGYGKTWLTNRAISRMKVKFGEVPTMVIVPTKDLQDQWETKALEWNMDITPVVVNGKVLKHEVIEYVRGTLTRIKLVVYDEIHAFIDGPLFSTIFGLCRNIRYQQGLSATLTELQKKKLKALGLPVVDTVTLEEGIRNKWVTEFKQYNLALTLSNEDRATYEYYYRKFENFFGWFGNDLEAMIGCMIEWDTRDRYGNVARLGAKNWCIEKGLGIDKVRETVRNANQGMEASHAYRTFLHKHPLKVKAVVDIINRYPRRRAITFGLFTETADELTALIPNSKACHSNVESATFVKGELVKYGYGNVTKLGKSRVNELTVKQFRAGEVNVLHTAKKLVLGFDAPQVSLLAIYGFIRSERNRIQTMGRGLRNDTPDTLIFNPFITDTKDEDYLADSQYGMKGIRVITNLNQVS